MRLAILGVLVAAVGLVAALPGKVLAVSTANIWAPQAPISIQQVSLTVSDSSFAGCNSEKIRLGYYEKLVYSYRQLDSCTVPTAYGSVAADGTAMRLGQLSLYRNFDSRYGTVTPIPFSAKLLVHGNIYSGMPSEYGIIDNAREAVVQATTYYGASMTFRLRTDKVIHRPLVNPAGGKPVRAIGSSVSRNGKWAVLEGVRNLIRYNTVTGELKNIGPVVAAYGVGTNPRYQMDITDDGRYVKVSGSNISNIYIIDADSCSVAAHGDLVATSVLCERRELAVGAPLSGSNVRWLEASGFRSNGRELLVKVYDNQWRESRYIITAGSPNDPDSYIALGDSFSSGEGDLDEQSKNYLPGTDGNDQYALEKCHISRLSYPFLLSERLTSPGLFNSLACSGAEMADILGEAKNGNNDYFGNFDQLKNHINNLPYLKSFSAEALLNNTPGRAPQKDFVGKYRPGSVTITIGGNDIDFADMIATCVTGITNYPTCSWATSEKATRGKNIQQLFGKLKNTYGQLINQNYSGRLYVLSYPQFISQKSKCAVNVQLDNAEREFMRNSLRYLNDVIEQAALAAGATFIDVEDALSGKELCSGARQLAFNGITSGDDIAMFGINLFGRESFHPNALGHRMIADYITAHYGRLPLLNGKRCPEKCSSLTAPPVPAYFGTGPGTRVLTKQDMVLSPIYQTLQTLKRPTVTVNTQFSGVSGGTVGFRLFSSPVDLGSLPADSSGRVNGELVLPAGLTPGIHTLHAYASVDGEAVDFYQTIAMAQSATDYDGDGIANDVDACQYIEASGIDADRDGIDDACDGQVDTGGSPVLAVATVRPDQSGGSVSAVGGRPAGRLSQSSFGLPWINDRRERASLPISYHPAIALSRNAGDWPGLAMAVVIAGASGLAICRHYFKKRHPIPTARTSDQQLSNRN